MPVIDQAPQLETDFRRLAGQWKRETKHLSRIDRVCAHPAYLQIIGMGPDALPLIFQELERETDYWFVALAAIARTSPVAEGDRLNVDQVAAAWLHWGREHGYLE